MRISAVMQSTSMRLKLGKWNKTTFKTTSNTLLIIYYVKTANMIWETRSKCMKGNNCQHKRWKHLWIISKNPKLTFQRWLLLWVHLNVCWFNLQQYNYMWPLNLKYSDDWDILSFGKHWQ